MALTSLTFLNVKDLHSRKKVPNFAPRLRIFAKTDIFIIINKVKYEECYQEAVHIAATI